MKASAIATICVLAVGTGALRAGAEGPKYERRTYETKHCGPVPPRIDGVPDDACWNAVEWAGDFVQWEPAEGQPPSYQTAFKILYDEHALYVAYRAFDDQPQKISEVLSRRDRFPGDWVEINIDSYFDHRTAFSFTSSVSGVRGDEFVSDDGDSWDGNWDPIWELRTHVDDKGWTAEVKIPLSQLRFGNKEEQVWGIQVQRRLFRKEERSLWQGKSKEEPGWVSRFGELRGIRDIHAQRQVELLPYTVGKGERFEKVPGDPFRDGSASNFALGLDGKVGVTSDLTLDFTFNPDFGQVEADPSEVNLSAFETRFAEKRPFFIEGNNILNFQLAPSIAGGSFTSDNLFYSRRIGRQPRYSPSLADGEHADLPNASSILGASKLTGKTPGGFSIGILESVTGKEKARIAGHGLEREESVEPVTNFFVGRVQQDFDRGDTRLGGMLTALHRNIDAAQLEFLHRNAYAGGVDFLRQWHNKDWYVAVNGAASRVEGEPAAILATQTAPARYFQRPDNDYEEVDSTRTSLSGHAGSMRLGKVGGKHWRFETGAAWRSPGFEINDAGFLRRADELNQFSWAGYSIRHPFSIFRNLSINFNQWLDWDFGGTNLDKQANTNFNLTFKNNWQVGAGATRILDLISNNALRGGPSFRQPDIWSNSFWVNSDYTKKLSVGFGGNFEDLDETPSRFRSGWVDLTLRPSNALQFTLSPSYSLNADEMQYVETASLGSESRYLFGTIDQKTAALTFRLDYTVRPNLTVQYYGAPFVSAGSYSDLKRITAPRAGAYRDRFHTFTGGEVSFSAGDNAYSFDENRDGTPDYSIDNPDFNVRDFNSNLVVRWEFQPGSLMYLVWSQARSDFVSKGTFSVHDDVGGLFDVSPHNIFLVKMSKWFSL